MCVCGVCGSKVRAIPISFQYFPFFIFLLFPNSAEVVSLAVLHIEIDEMENENDRNISSELRPNGIYKKLQQEFVFLAVL